MTEETKELTPEEIKAEEDKFFIAATQPDSMQRIQQGGEFLNPAPTDTMYSDESATKQIVEEAQKHYNKCAAIAALEYSPGLQMILERIEYMRNLFHTDNEDMVNKGEFDASKMQANIYASAKFNDLKNWIDGQMKDYKEKIKESQFEEEEVH